MKHYPQIITQVDGNGDVEYMVRVYNPLWFLPGIDSPIGSKWLSIGTYPTRELALFMARNYIRETLSKEIHTIQTETVYE